MTSPIISTLFSSSKSFVSYSPIVTYF